MKVGDDYQKQYTLFDNQFQLNTEMNEMGRMSHYVNGFDIIEIKSGRKLLELINMDFDLAEFKENGDLWEIRFRIYPDGSKAYDAQINLFKEKFYYENQELDLSQFYEFYYNFLDSSFK